MEDYYIVYDMSPLEKGKNYIQVGIGLQNIHNWAGEQQYDKTSEHWAPLDQEFDSSILEDGKTDPYADESYSEKNR